MKKLILLLMLVVAGVKGASAQEAVAVLKSGDVTKTYAGFNALQNAYADAKDGDLITLSSGTFGAVAEIAKSITIRGAGQGIDGTYKTQPTYINGNYMIAKTSVQLEGLHHPEGSIVTLKAGNSKIIKCKLWGVRMATGVKDGKDVYWSINNVYFLHCQILNEVVCPANSSMSFVNCQVYHPQTWSSSSSAMVFRNCVVISTTDGSGSGSTVKQTWNAGTYGEYTHVYGSSFINCVVIENNNLYTNEYTTFTNCLFYPNTNNVKGSPSYSNCWQNSNWDNIFVKDSWYVFTDTSKSKFLDEYGREIGIHGGTFPYSWRVAGPHIKSMEVAPRSTADGKLRVKMTVQNSSY